MLKIRAAVPDDLETLRTLSGDARAERQDTVYADPNVLAAVLEKTIPGTVLLAFSDDVPVGYCAFCISGSVRCASR